MQDINRSLELKELSKSGGGFRMSVTNTKDISDCISNWLAYLQMLNGLCSAGSRLSNCFCGLVTENPTLTIQNQAMWEELVRACTVASSNIKTQVLPALQELTVSELNPETRTLDSTQIVNNSLAAFINLQYQLCAACCECLAPILGCPCPYFPSSSGDASIKHHEADCSAEAMQKCFQRLFPPPPPSHNQGSKSPQLFTLSPLQACQRRWSEAAAQEAASAGGTAECSDIDGGTMRRWSMPWETSVQPTWPGSRLMPKHNKLAVPGTSPGETRSRSTTPESAWHSSTASQEELQQVIQLLSTGPNNRPALKPPTLTVDDPCGWSSEATTPGSRRGSNSPHRGGSTGGAGQWEDGLGVLGAAGEIRRKSSSSTETDSSSYSIGRGSNSGGDSGGCGGSAATAPVQDIRSQGYSMWAGADAPLIKLPDSNETLEEHATAGQDLRHTFFTHKSH